MAALNNKRDSARVEIKGQLNDQETRCVHWDSKLDIVAIKFYCCEEYFACYDCHEEEASHYLKTWPKHKFDEKAVMCGSCKHEMSINQYLNSRDRCPSCNAEFNPSCRNHWGRYFELC